MAEAKTITAIKDLTPDTNNANAHTQRGMAMTESSVRRYKFGRSVLVDKNGKSIAGAGVIQTAADVVGQDADVIVVQSDGTKLVVVQRTDLDIDTDVDAKALAIADNQAGAVGLKWDAGNLQELEQQGVNMGEFFRPTEWDKILEASDENDNDGSEEIPEMALQPFEEHDYIMIVFKNSQDWQGACDRLGIKREAVTLAGTRKVGLGRVISGERLMEALK